MFGPVELKKGRTVIATIEARMTSRRLPGKVLLEACGKPMLELMIERVRRIEYLDDIVVATTVNGTDQPIVDLCRALGVKVFRGSEDDVLARVLGAARANGADVIVELTGDCPLIDPSVATQVVEFYLIHGFDYVSNDHLRTAKSLAYDTYPWGMDTQVFSTAVLARADIETDDPEDREHVSRYIIREPKFTHTIITAPPDLRRPELIFTLDEPADYSVIKSVFERLYSRNPAFSIRDVIALMDADPAAFRANASLPRSVDSYELKAQGQ